MNMHEWAKEADTLLAAYPNKPKQRQKILIEYFEYAFRAGEKKSVYGHLDIAGLCATVAASIRRGETDTQARQRMLDAIDAQVS